MSIAIIGAGITGLTLALELKKKGFEVQVYEVSGRAGGVIRTHRNNGWVAEGGPNSILESSTRIGALIRDLDLDGEIQYANKAAEKRYIVRNGRPAAVPGSALEFIRSRLLSNKSKLMILKEPFTKAPKGDDEESLADFVRRRLGGEVLDNFVYPFVGGIYAGDPEKLSVRFAFKRLYNLEKKYGSLIKGQFKAAKDRSEHEIPRNKAKTFSFHNGLETLPEALHQKLKKEIKLNTVVRSVAFENGAFQVVAEEQGSANQYRHDAVVYCGAAHSIDSLGFQLKGSENPSELSGITYPPVTSVVLGYHRDQVGHPLDGFGVLIPEKEDFTILGAQFNSTVFPERVPDKNHVMMTVFIGGTRFPDSIKMNSEDLLSIAHSNLQILLDITGEPVFSHQSRWPKAIPQYNIGYGRFLDVMAKTEEDNPGFYFAGNYRNGISVGDCISHAADLATRIQAELGSHL